MSEICNRID